MGDGVVMLIILAGLTGLMLGTTSVQAAWDEVRPGALLFGLLLGVFYMWVVISAIVTF